MLRFPGESYRGPLPALTDSEAALGEALRRDLLVLAQTIGERNVYLPAKLAETVAFIERGFVEAGYHVQRQSLLAEGQTCQNLEVELPGSQRPAEIVIVGAHYDSVRGCPGANDNGSGVVATLALARALAHSKPARTVRFVAFANEESPFFGTPAMGAVAYARRCRERRENIVGMISLETIGYYSDVEKSQRYPAPFNLFYPSTGNFIGFIGNIRSRQLVRAAIVAFRQETRFPSEGAALPEAVPGVGWSDHWAFWQEGYQAMMVTDTAPFRYPHYHTPQDTPDKLDYDRMARVVAGLEKMLGHLLASR
jgi:Zn-dependent M28 family amino/carboxypeptidase